MTPCMLLAYDADGNVIATLDYMTASDDDGNVVGMIDFAAHEAAGGRLREVWDVQGAVGSTTWPEWLGARASDFRVELTQKGARAVALVHRQSGHRRERAGIEAAVAMASDTRRVVGAPDRPIRLDDAGRTLTPGALPSRRPWPVVTG